MALVLRVTVHERRPWSWFWASHLKEECGRHRTMCVRYGPHYCAGTVTTLLRLDDYYCYLQRDVKCVHPIDQLKIPEILSCSPSFALLRSIQPVSYLAFDLTSSTTTRYRGS